MAKPDFEVRPGDLFQVTDESEGRGGWRGAVVQVTEPKTWGVMGFVHVIETHEKSGRAYIRYPWEMIEYVGRAVLVPADEAETEET